MNKGFQSNVYRFVQKVLRCPKSPNRTGFERREDVFDDLQDVYIKLISTKDFDAKWKRFYEWEKVDYVLKTCASVQIDRVKKQTRQKRRLGKEVEKRATEYNGHLIEEELERIEDMKIETSYEQFLENNAERLTPLEKRMWLPEQQAYQKALKQELAATVTFLETAPASIFNPLLEYAFGKSLQEIALESNISTITLYRQMHKTRKMINRWREAYRLANPTPFREVE